MIEPKYIAHFTKFDTLMKYILPESKLKLGSMVNSNDSIERRMNISFEVDVIPKDEILQRKVIESIKMICFKYSLESDINSALTDFVYKSCSMWSHYANFSSGVCIIFNKEKLESQIKSQAIQHNSTFISSQIIQYYSHQDVGDYNKKLKLLKPCYEGKYSCVKDYLNNDENMDIVKTAMFIKSYGWQHEKEFRISVSSEADCYFKFDLEDCIEGIILGLNCKAKDEEIRKISTLNGITVYQHIYQAEHAKDLLYKYDENIQPILISTGHNL